MPVITGSAGFFDLAEQKLDWLDQRSRVLAGDVANADTPGFVARDLTPFAQTLSPFHLALAGTEGEGLDAAAGASSQTASTTERAPDGNGVSLDHTLASIAQTADAQSEVTTLYRKYVGLEMTALGVGGAG